MIKYDLVMTWAMLVHQNKKSLKIAISFFGLHEFTLFQYL